MSNDILDKIRLIETKLANDEIVTFGNDSMTLKKFRELESTMKPDIDKPFKDTIVFWDDVFQYTTLGLVELLLESFEDIVDKDWDYDLFFYRGLENTNYITFVINLFKTKFNKDLTKESIEIFFKENYIKILYSSPATSLYYTIFRCESMYKSITFCFRYKFKGIEKFTTSISGHFTGKFKFPITYAYLDGVSEADYLIKGGTRYDIIMIQNIKLALDYILHTKERGINIMGPYGHNGVSESFFTTFAAIFNRGNIGPYNSKIIIYNEGVSIC